MNYRVLFGVVFILLLFFSAFLWISNSNKDVKLSEAKELTENLRTYFKLSGERCRARADDFVAMNDCLGIIMGEYEIVANLDEEDFQLYSEKRNQTGFIVLINEGRNSMESSKFVLLHNREVLDEGCVIEGSIDPSYTCRLDYDRPCESGDVLEVTYDGKRAYIKNC